MEIVDRILFMILFQWSSFRSDNSQFSKIESILFTCPSFKMILDVGFFCGSRTMLYYTVLYRPALIGEERFSTSKEHERISNFSEANCGWFENLNRFVCCDCAQHRQDMIMMTIFALIVSGAIVSHFHFFLNGSCLQLARSSYCHLGMAPYKLDKKLLLWQKWRNEDAVTATPISRRSING